VAEKLGPYQIHSELGRGAMAVVWRARDTVLERDVAVKEPLLPEGIDTVDAAEFGARFVREAKAAAKLNHPNIVTIHAADIYDGRPAIVMELVEGETLRQLLSRGPVKPTLALGILEQLLSAMAYAHARGIVHRDIKPDNVFVTPDGVVKLADFGIASLASDSALTQAGTIMGTPGYMAPEQVTGEPVDARADIFAIGVLAYEMLTGKNPFGASDELPTTTIIYRIVHQAPPEIPAGALSGVPVDMRQVLGAALAKDPADRFPDAASFLAALKGEGPLPVPTTEGARVGRLEVGGPEIGTRVAAVLSRVAAFWRKPEVRSWLARPFRDRRWLKSWVPYAVLAGVGLIVMIVLLVRPSGAPPVAVVDLSTFATITASDEYLPGGDNPGYFVENLTDGDRLTSWGVHDGGPGAWVDFTFESEVTVTELRVIVGYDKADQYFDRWPCNNRMRGYRVQFSDGTSEVGEVMDLRGVQTISFPPIKTTSVRLKILSVYPFQKSGQYGVNDTYLSELSPWGYQ
jgi:hypothetical protein